MAGKDIKLDTLVGMFEIGPKERMMQRILDRAVEARVRQNERQAKKQGVKIRRAFNVKQNRARTKNALIKAFQKAMAGRSGKAGQTSIRQKAPDSGGTPFHFQVYSVAKGPERGPKTYSSTKGRLKGGGLATAHMHYIERDGAVEQLTPEQAAEEAIKAQIELGMTFEPTLGQNPLAAQKDKAADLENGFELTPYIPGVAKAAQTYIENPVKLANGEAILASFGNISDKFEDRLRFWELVEEYEPRGDSRIQNRIICELPHQATPQQRFDIIKTYVEQFELEGLPYHVALHAPGKKNDDRNYHAHVVFSERPAKRIVNPETGELQWDFTIAATKIDATRHKITVYPFRQKRKRDIKEWDFVTKERQRFAKSVNDVMGTTVYDPRSYKTMGLDIVPIQSINRIVASQLRGNRVFMRDDDWSERMLNATLAKAAYERDSDVRDMYEIKKVLDKLETAFPDRKKLNAVLKQEGKGPIERGHKLTQAYLKDFATKRLTRALEDVQEKLITKSLLEVCSKIMEATDPDKLDNIKKFLKPDPLNPDQMPDLPTKTAMTAIYKAAKAEYDGQISRGRREQNRIQASIKNLTVGFFKRAAPILMAGGTETAPAATSPAAEPSQAKPVSYRDRQITVPAESRFDLDIDDTTKSQGKARKRAQVAAETNLNSQAAAERPKLKGLKTSPEVQITAGEDLDPRDMMRKVLQRRLAPGLGQVQATMNHINNQLAHLQGQDFADAVLALSERLAQPIPQAAAPSLAPADPSQNLDPSPAPVIEPASLGDAPKPPQGLGLVPLPQSLDPPAPQPAATQIPNTAEPVTANRQNGQTIGKEPEPAVQPARPGRHQPPAEVPKPTQPQRPADLALPVAPRRSRAVSAPPAEDQANAKASAQDSQAAPIDAPRRQPNSSASTLQPAKTRRLTEVQEIPGQSHDQNRGQNARSEANPNIKAPDLTSGQRPTPARTKQANDTAAAQTTKPVARRPAQTPGQIPEEPAKARRAKAKPIDSQTQPETALSETEALKKKLRRKAMLAKKIRDKGRGR